MELEEKYNELANMIYDLEHVVADLDVEYMSNYMSELLFTIDEAKKEMNEIEGQLMYDNELGKKIDEAQYWKESLESFGGYC